MSKRQKSRPSGGTVFRAVKCYEHDTLGAPFKVLLINSVSVAVDPKSGEELVRIPDPIGLVRAVVRCRVQDPRKLSGADLRFIRRALDVRANKLAAVLDFSPEHYSRCEAGGRVLGPAAERMLRLFAYVATLCSDPNELLDSPKRRAEDTPRFRDQKSEREALKFINVFMKMTIQPLRDADEVIEYTLSRRPPGKEPTAETADDAHVEDADWKRLQPRARRAA